jgi:hypothetical protein
VVGEKLGPFVVICQFQTRFAGHHRIKDAIERPKSA